VRKAGLGFEEISGGRRKEMEFAVVFDFVKHEKSVIVGYGMRSALIVGWDVELQDLREASSNRCGGVRSMTLLSG
jgi:hypothetical protein